MSKSCDICVREARNAGFSQADAERLNPASYKSVSPRGVSVFVCKRCYPTALTGYGNIEPLENTNENAVERMREEYSKAVTAPDEPRPTPEEITLSHLRSELRIAIELETDPKRLRAALKSLAGKE